MKRDMIRGLDLFIPRCNSDVSFDSLEFVAVVYSTVAEGKTNCSQRLKEKQTEIPIHPLS